MAEVNCLPTTGLLRHKMLKQIQSVKEVPTIQSTCQCCQGLFCPIKRKLKLLNLLLHRSFPGSRVLFSFRASINGFKRAELTIFLASILSFPSVCLRRVFFQYMPYYLQRLPRKVYPIK